MRSIEQVRKAPLSAITFPAEAVSLTNNLFIDIIQRNSCNGDMLAMLREAYVLGMHHAVNLGVPQ